MGELNETPEVPVSGDSQGQAGDSEPKAAEPQSKNWTDDPEYRRLQSEQDRRYELERQAREQAERQARILASQLAAQQKAFAETDPDAAAQAQALAVIEAQKAELASYHAREARDAYVDYFSREAESIEPGLSNNAEFRAAIQSDIQNGSNAAVQEFLLTTKITKKLQAQTPKARPAAQETEDEEVANKRTPSGEGYVPPPPGTAPRKKGTPEEIERLDEEYLRLSKDWTKNQALLTANREKRKQLEG